MKKGANSNLKNIILGGQDGLVNVLGIVLGVAAATYENKIVIIAGLAATFAESVSMAAVAYTSTDAALSYYSYKLKKQKILNLLKKEYENPRKSAYIVGLSSFIGSLIPLVPFFFLNITSGIFLSLILASLALFITGSIKGRLSNQNSLKEGTRMLIIGMLAALIGYLIGFLMGKINLP